MMTQTSRRGPASGGLDLRYEFERIKGIFHLVEL